MKHAVVIGGSVAGLAAARVLADHFEQVTVIERDPLPDGPIRKGVPQERHNHVLLLKGQQILEQLFPGLLADLTDPVFAQGMTTAALGAEALDACLTAQAGGITGLSRRFQQALAKAVHGPWLAAAGADLAYKQAEGKRQPGSGIITWYMRRIALLCGKDPDVMRRFVKVMHLVEPPTVLFNLRTVLLALTAGADHPHYRSASGCVEIISGVAGISVV